METNTSKLRLHLFHPSRPCQRVQEHNGRAELIRQVVGHLGNDPVQSVALLGTEKMGKTSVLNYLRQPGALIDQLRESHQYLFVYLDAKTPELSNEQAFFKTLFSEEPFTYLPGLNSAMDLSYLIQWLDSQDKRLIVMIDNFHLMVSNPDFRGPFYDRLSHWLSTQPRVGCVVTSNEPLLPLATSRELPGAPFSIFTAYSLTPLMSEDARRLLTQRLPTYLRDRTADLDQLLEEFGHFPYPLQQAGKCWVKLAEHSHIPPLTEVIDAAYQACADYYESIYVRVQSSRSVIGGLLDKHQSKPKIEDIDRSLIEQGWVSEDEDGPSIPARQLARFFRSKWGLPEESVGVWQRIISGLTSRFRKNVEVVQAGETSPPLAPAAGIEKPSVQVYQEQLQELLQELAQANTTTTLAERQRLDKSVTDLQLSSQQALQLEQQIRGQLHLPGLNWLDEYKESCRVLVRRYSRYQVPVAELQALKATYEDQQRVDPTTAKEIRQIYEVERKGPLVWQVGMGVGVLLLVVVGGLWWSGLLTSLLEKAVGPESNSTQTTSSVTNQETSVVKSGAGTLTPEAKSDETKPAATKEEKSTEVKVEKPVTPKETSAKSDDANTPSGTTSEAPTSLVKTEQQTTETATPTEGVPVTESSTTSVGPKVTPITGYDYLVVDLIDGKKKLLLGNSSKNETVPLLEGFEEEQSHPNISQDNQFLTFQQGQEKICLIQLAQGTVACQPGKTPHLSPNGSKVVYVPLDSENALGIWPTDTQSQQTVTFKNETGISSPVFLSDNQHIVFKASTGGMSQVFLYDSAKEISRLNPKVLASSSTTTLVASPTENRVLGKNNHGWFAMVFNLDSNATSEKQELSIGTNAKLSFSKDGKELYYIDDKRITYSPLTPPQWPRPKRVDISLTDPREVVPLR